MGPPYSFIFKSMTEMKIFLKPFFWEIRTVKLPEGQVPFVDKNVATAVGYTKADKVMKQHVETDDSWGTKSVHQVKKEITLIANLLLMVMQKHIKRTWNFSRLATMYRIMLMYYVSSYSSFDALEKDCIVSIQKKVS